LNLKDKEKIISDYLDSDVPNLNYTRLLSKVQDTECYQIRFGAILEYGNE